MSSSSPDKHSSSAVPAAEAILPTSQPIDTSIIDQEIVNLSAGVVVDKQGSCVVQEENKEKASENTMSTSAIVKENGKFQAPEHGGTLQQHENLEQASMDTSAPENVTTAIIETGSTQETMETASVDATSTTASSFDQTSLIMSRSAIVEENGSSHKNQNGRFQVTMETASIDTPASDNLNLSTNAIIENGGFDPTERNGGLHEEKMETASADVTNTTASSFDPDTTADSPTSGGDSDDASEEGEEKRSKKSGGGVKKKKKGGRFSKKSGKRIWWKQPEKGPSIPIGPFTAAGFIQEPYVADCARSIYGIAFNPFVGRNSDQCYLATVAGNTISVYLSSSRTFECLHSVDIAPFPAEEDVGRRPLVKKPDDFWCVVWLYHRHSGEFYLAAAGELGSITIVKASNLAISGVLQAHSNSVNELTVHPKDPALLLSCGKDGLMCLWNTKSMVLVAIYGGNGLADTHCSEVLSVDFNSTGDRFASGGQDFSIRIWLVTENEVVKKAIARSHEWTGINSTASYQASAMGLACMPQNRDKCFNTAQITESFFATCDPHRNFVDCVRWWGPYILSKSLEGTLMLWKPCEPKDRIVLPMRRFVLPRSVLWYMRFAVSRDYKTLAFGDETGVIHVFNLEADGSCGEPTEGVPLIHNECYNTVRICAFSPNGKHIVAACDDGMLFRWSIGRLYEGWEKDRTNPEIEAVVAVRQAENAAKAAAARAEAELAEKNKYGGFVFPEKLPEKAKTDAEACEIVKNGE